jgi:hypothetical protein
MTKPIPYVQAGHLHAPTGAVICAVPSSPPMRTGWIDWLGNRDNRSFRFIGASGITCTVNKESRAGSSGTIFWYWYAARHVLGKHRRVYLGKAEALTLDILEAGAAKLAQLELDSAMAE